MKKVYLGKDAEDRVFAGAENLYNAVKVTLGPKGRNFMIAKKYMSPFLTHDGVTVATNAEGKDPSEEVGASFIREAARKNAKDVGDGTTTTTIMSYSLLKGYRDTITNPMVLSKELNEEAEKLCAQLKPLDDINLEAVATLSAADPEIGKVIDNALSTVGKDGSVLIEASRDEAVEVEFVDGMRLNCGYVSPYMANDDRGRAVLEDVNVYVTTKALVTEGDLISILQKAGEKAKRLFIIADEVSREVVAKIQFFNGGELNIVAVKSPGIGSRRQLVLEDICAVTNSTLDDESKLGWAKKIVVTADDTVITGQPDPKRKLQLENELKAAQTQRDEEFIKQRIAGLEGRVAIIHVGGRTDAEITEKVFRIEDAVAAGRAALEDGVVVGGGMTYLSLKTSDTQAGQLFKQALKEPFNHLMENAGIDPDKALVDLPEGLGIDVMNPEKPTNLVEVGIIEPLALVKAVIKTSASIVGSLITMGGLIVEEEKDDA